MKTLAPSFSFALLLALVPALAHAAPAWQAASPAAEEPPRNCRDRIVADPALEAALRALAFESEGGRKPLREVRIAGLTTLDERALWDLLGGKPAEIDSGWGALAVRRLANLGVFAALTPVIDVRAPGGPLLTINVVEHPTVRRVTIEGLAEHKPEGLLEVLFALPSRKDVARGLSDWEKFFQRTKQKIEEAEEKKKKGSEDDDDDEELEQQIEEEIERAIEKELAHDKKDQDKHDKDDDNKTARPLRDCPDPLPLPEWLAHAEGNVVYPGIAWKGLEAGLQRVLERLRGKGYLLATLTASLAPDGALTIRVNEGAVARVDVAGVAPQIAERVRSLVVTDVAPGQPLVRSDLDAAGGRVRRAFPFLRLDSRERKEPRRRQVVARARDGGAIEYVTEDKPQTTGGSWFTVEESVVTVHFKSRRFEHATDFEELIRHTPVTSFAPGVEAHFRFWDPADRIHLRAFAGGNVNGQAARTPAPADGSAARRYRFDWLAGGSLAVPLLGLAELGGQGYARVDTADRWRIHRVDSYLNSLFFNRADSDYFRRSGFTLFATTHLFDRLTAGVEYRRDRYRTLVSQDDMFTFFHRAEAPQPTAPIDDLTLGSLLFRLEWSSVAAPAHKVGDVNRDPERTIVRRGDRAAWAELRTMNTLELANPSLGGADGISFVRLVSDSALFLRTGSDQGFKLRFRAAGRVGGERDDLIRQKQESLGGWSAVRGLGWKEQRGGDFSLLGTAEYRLENFSLFVDVGSLRGPTGFAPAKAGVGLAFNFDEQAHIDFAWRADDRARLRPEIRLLFHRTF